MSALSGVESYKFQAFEMRSEYVNGGRSVSGPANPPGEDAPPMRYEDVLDIRNSRRLEHGPETVMSMLEEKSKEKIEKALGKDCECEPVDDYWSPEKTAGRIVDFAMKFYDAYAASNGGESEETLDEFLSLVGGAIDEGFSQARAIIGEEEPGKGRGEGRENAEGKGQAGKLPDRIESLLQSTRDHITSLLEEFRKSVLDRLNGEDESEEDETAVDLEIGAKVETEYEAEVESAALQ